MRRLLVADDDAGMRTALEARFLRRGWGVDLAASGAEALHKFRPELHTLVITDVRMPGCDGFELMRSVQAASPQTPVVLLTAYACVPDAVEAMRSGACDYLVKPVSFEKIELTVEQVLHRAERQSCREMGSRKQTEEKQTLVGHSAAWQQALACAHKAASCDADVLIEAESGTGKELVAHLIHRLSRRKLGPLVALNCAAFPEALLESELFGHTRGAFTGAVGARPGKFETASGGTLLLDEVGEMPLTLQPKLLRALQEREFDPLGSNQTVRVDIRVIATTNRPLAAAVAEGRFRADLYYRMNVIPIVLPPLRERRGDIGELARYFAKLYRSPGTETHLSDALIARLEEQPWPGNVRELANFVQRALAMSSGSEIGPEALEYGKLPDAAPLPPLGWKAGLSLEEMERQLFAMTLDATGGNRARAAELLGVSLRTVRNKVREFGLPPRSNYRSPLCP